MGEKRGVERGEALSGWMGWDCGNGRCRQETRSARAGFLRYWIRRFSYVVGGKY